MALLAAIMCVYFVACSSNDDNADYVEAIITPSDNSRQFFNNGITFSADSNSEVVEFTATADWSLTIANTVSGTDWCTASVNSGKAGENSIVIQTTQNTGYDDRSVTLTLKSGNITKTIVVTQKQKDAILLTADKFEVDQEGKTITIEVKANVNYTATISETCKEWISEEETSTRSLSTTTRKYTIAANAEYEKREGAIIVSNGTLSETVHVYQAGGAILLLTQDIYPVSPEGEVIQVELKSNFEYETKMPEVDWITVAQTKTVSSHTLYYNILPNESYDSREAQIVYYDKNSNISDTLTIRQAQKDAIVISQKEVSVKSKGATIEVKLSANVDFEMLLPTTNPKWISEPKDTRAMIEHSKFLVISENVSNSERKASVIFRNKENRSIADTLQITQNGRGIMQVTKDKYTVEATGGDITVNLKTNQDYDIIMPEIDWVNKAVKTKAITTYYESFIISPNNTYNERSAQIIFKSKIDDSSATVTIIQKQRNAIILPIKELTVKAGKDTIAVSISTNISFNVECYANWIKQYHGTTTKALNDSALYFIVDTNSDYNARKTNIIFKGDYYSSYVSDTIQIKQEGRSTTPALVLNIAPAGSLKTLISDSRKGQVEEMKLTGELNGSDFAFIKEMTKLENLDISEANIVAGGSAYYHSDQIGGNYAGTYVPEFDLYTKPNSIIGNMFPASLQVLTLPKNLITFSGYPVVKYNREGNKIFGWKDTPDGYLASYVFGDKSNIKKIICPDGISLKEIGSNSLTGCSQLYELAIPSGIEIIRKQAITACTNLTELSIPSSVTTIESQAFMNNWNLNTANLPNKLAEISDSLFYNCRNLSNIIIPQSITKIGKLAFSHTNIQSINIPNSVRTIEEAAFLSCSNLTNITLPNSITAIKLSTFSGTGITQIAIPNSVTEIGDGAFLSCQKLVSIVIPNSVITVGESAFRDCIRLNNMALSENLSFIAENCFKDCRMLTAITIPQNIKDIKDMAFSGCSSLQTLVIPDGVVNIGNSAFFKNNALTTITLGRGLKTIGSLSFAKYFKNRETKIYYSEIKCYAEIPAIISSSSSGYSNIVPEGYPKHAFDNGINNDTKLYIPKGTYNTYYLSDWANWFKNIVEFE